MNILIINGSLRKQGNTARTVELLQEAIHRNVPDTPSEIQGQNQIVIRTVNLSEVDLRPCRGCRVCFNRGELHCPQKDDVLALHADILASDCVVLASPVYVNDVSGSMKTLIDRLAFVCHRPAYMNTLFFLLATTGGTPVKHTVRTLQSAVVSWGGQLVGWIGCSTGALSSQEEIKARYGKTLEKKGRDITASVVEQKQKKPGFIALLVFAIQQASWKKVFDRMENDSIDAHYWRDNGWLDKRCTYFTDHSSGKIKTAAARMIGKTISRFIA